MELQPENLLEPMLSESIYHFLVESQNGRTDFSELTSIFFRLIQTMTDPPLEFIWFYSALAFQTHSNSTNYSLLTNVKDLFHLLTSFRTPCFSKKVAILAPVLYHLFYSSSNDCKTEVQSLADRIVSYLVMCCENSEVVEPEDEVGMSWVGVVPVWIAGQVRENCGRVDGLQLFLPMSSGRGVDGEFGMDRLAGVVMIEAFLFRLCLMFGSGASRVDLCRDVKSYAVQMVKGFKKNSNFLVTLFKLLLEPSLPVTELLTTTDELLLRRLLFDVASDLGSFLRSDAYSQLSDSKYKEIVTLWLFATNSALQFASENDDQAGVKYYLNAFSASQLPHQIIAWVTGVTSIKPTIPDISSPKDIIGWLLVLEKQGLKICDYSISELHEKTLKYKSMEIGNEITDCQTMVEDAPAKINCRRKRDSTGFGEVQKHIKAMKCCHENLGDEVFCGRIEVGNSVPDQEMVDMVH
uniref:uncharacterized protein LOC122579632 n=1 Tax=Erigeron canadensis TaxID=72917 RepID=UPI001CB91FA4|nr:uncharacterized protein LOC122579632 [Erigeron canadensis]